MSSEDFYHDYWKEFAAIAACYPSGLPEGVRRNYYVRFPKSGFGFQRSAIAVRSKGHIGVEFICETSVAGQALERLDELRRTTSATLLDTYPGKIEWYGSADQKIAKAWEVIPANLDDRRDWPAQHLWLCCRLMVMESIFGPIARSLGTKAR